MKVKNPSYLRSLTALLRSSVQNSSDPNEGCEPWYVAVPSVTYFWTHRPQWRRRHKKRKQSNTPRFPALKYARLNDDDLLDILRIVERPLSRASTSPYETCSSRQIVVDSESSKNYNDSDNHEDYDIRLSQQNREFDRNLFAIESRSDSGLRKSGEQQLNRLIRSQRRLGSARNAVNNGPAGTVTFSTAEVNRMVQSSERRESQLDCIVPKRRVTFDNCVSTESSIDTRNRENAKINNSDAYQWQESYVRLSEDDDDDISLQTDLDHLFSSMIFDLSSKSSLSVTSSQTLEKPKKTQSQSFEKTGESIVYINSSFVKESSSDLLPVKKIFSIENHPEHDKSLLQKCDKNNEDVEVIEILTKNCTKDENVCKHVKKSLNDENDSTYQQSIEHIILELKNLTDKEMAPPPRRIIDHRSILCSSAPKNHISTDTSDLLELYRTPKPYPVTELPKTLVNNVGLNISDIIDLIKPPIGQMNTIFHELSTVDKKTVTPIGTEKRIVENTGKIRKYGSSESSNSGVEKVDLLRIETETDGEYESLFIEMKDLRENLRDSGFLENLLPLKTDKYSQPLYEPIVNNSPGARRNSEFTNSSSHRNDHKSCSIDECCTICGRTRIDNPRYLRPVCRVKGVTLTPRLENDPWINVINRVMKHASGREIVPQIRKKQQTVETRNRNESSNQVEDVNKNNEIHENDGIVALEAKDPEVVEKEEMECFSVFVKETDNSISTDDSNGPGSRDQSTSCSSPESGLDSLSSYDCGTRLRGQLAKAYCTRESVRTVNVTSNRLLCVISESDTLMGLPQFLPKKPPDWYPRQVPRRKSSRR